jgi:deazaflavin-dependent oxidoreductase (nitroreductase family)
MTTRSTYADANPVQRAVRRFAATGVGDWLFAHVLRRLDGPVHRLTRGRHTAANLLSGLPVVHLTTTGARTGALRTVPLLGVPVEDGLAVIASNFGSGRDPGWYHNLRAHPDAFVTVDGVRHTVRAVEACGPARDRIWRQGLDIFPGWSAYERRAGGRTIPVVVLVDVATAADRIPAASGGS